MKLERLHSSSIKMTLSTYELSALISAARWVANGAEGELSSEAKSYLAQIVSDYDAALGKMNEV